MDRPAWTTPTIEALNDYRMLPYRGSDTSYVNLFQLRHKYKLEIASHDGVLFRYYHGKNANRQGYGFPLSSDRFDADRIFQMIKNDAKDRGGIRFCLCDEMQKEVISKYFDIDWRTEEGDNDYIYESEKWLTFSGRKYHHLKYKLNHFNRTYDDAEYFPIDSDERLADALRVSEVWQHEHTDKEMPDEDLDLEQSCITEVSKHWHELGMTGGVMYVGGSPVAMTMASFLSNDSVDFHFDKAIGEFAAAGATVVSRRSFVANGIAKGRQFFNLEEDMNIPGLRQSKETYRPMCKLKKYYGEAAVTSR
ncbi:MAG: DUF2156 domain-containing protein [Lachnospiraceae bacterium]|nr:DUF2156 domain-containing protein [Lachnospiraceae bacterium]